MSFIAVNPAPTSNTPAPPVPDLIQNAKFFPDISLAEMRQRQRLDGTVTDARLREQLLIAMASVNGELAKWADAHKSQGWRTLAEVPAEQLGGESINVTLYRCAVGSHAAAVLNERYPDFSATKDGEKRAADLKTASDDLRRDEREAIRQILGVPRCTIELL